MVPPGRQQNGQKDGPDLQADEVSKQLIRHKAPLSDLAVHPARED